MKRLLVVCAVIENAQGCLLLCKRPLAKSQGGLWEFPGGKVDDGESEEQALIREIREELQCDILIQQKLTPVEHDYSDLALTLVPYLCSLPQGSEPCATEHEEIRWISLSSILGMSLAAADLPILRELLDRERIE